MHPRQLTFSRAARQHISPSAPSNSGSARSNPARKRRDKHRGEFRTHETAPGLKVILVSSATLISRPYQQRRAYATARKSWPELDIICTSRPQALNDYITNIGDEVKVLNMLVGDTQRIWRYAEAEFATPQPVDEATLNVYHRLVEQGYTRRLI